MTSVDRFKLDMKSCIQHLLFEGMNANILVFDRQGKEDISERLIFLMNHNLYISYQDRLKTVIVPGDCYLGNIVDKFNDIDFIHCPTEFNFKMVDLYLREGAHLPTWPNLYQEVIIGIGNNNVILGIY